MPILFCTTSSFVSAGLAGEASLLFIVSEKTGQNRATTVACNPKTQSQAARDGGDRNHCSLSPRVHPLPAQIVARHQGAAARYLGCQKDRAGSSGVSAVFRGRS